MKNSFFRKEVIDKIYSRHHGQIFNKRKIPILVPILFICAILSIAIAVEMDVIEKIKINLFVVKIGHEV